MSKDEWLDEFGNNLQALMRENDITQRELERKSGVSQSDLSRYVNGRQAPTYKAIINLSYALECDVADLIDFGEMIED